MLTRVKIENYRGFQSFRLDGLTTVNLLVGKNNSGKTALLEGVQFLASGGDPMVLVNAARRRGEFVSAMMEEPFVDVSHFFFGHDISAGSRFSLTPDNATPVTVEAVPAGVFEAPGLTDNFEYNIPDFGLNIRSGSRESENGHLFVLTQKRATLVDHFLSRVQESFGETPATKAPDSTRKSYWEARREGQAIVFITPDSLTPISLGAMWDRVLREKKEGEIRKAMQLLEPGLEDIVFQTGEVTHRGYDRYFPGQSGVLVSFAGDQRRVPLGSMGDGMRRLLALSISLAHAKGGYLLIDEIDTGLHYSIMAKTWELVVRTAKELGIQVFATTHSADCVRGLGVLCKRSPELQPEVSAHKIERSLDANVAFSGADVLNAVEQDIEIR